MDMSMLMTNWIWLPEWTPEDNSDARIVYFRKEITITKKPESKRIKISADSRYKLYVNGRFVQDGPQKALDLKDWYVDEAELAPFLQTGANAIAVEVLRYPAFGNVNDSLLRSEMPHLYVDDANAPELCLAAKTGWKCLINREVRILSEETRPAPIHAQEGVNASEKFAFWKLPRYDDSAWHDAKPKMIFDIAMAEAPYHQVPRTIPLMRQEEKCFLSVSAQRQGSADFTSLIAGKAVTIPAHTTEIVELSAGAEECGYLLYTFAGGRGATVTTLCSECYAYPQSPTRSPMGVPVQPAPKKGDRTDAENGVLLGHTSTYTVAGYGTPDRPETYEPYLFRTFRYVQLKIETADEALTLLDFSYRATGYPVDVQTNAHASDPSFAGIWDISVRTLRRCMHETYMDCPFYEQLQYAMDGRSEILYTYALSADDRLARQAMEAFRRSQRPEGLVNADAPTRRSNVIPGFSIYYLLMVHDHMMYFGDRDLVKQHLPSIDRLLAFFDRHLLPSGLVGKVGGPYLRHPYWSFIDWTDKWMSGVPNASNVGDGAITMESLLYLYGLQKAAELADFTGRPGLGEEYRIRAAALTDAIRKNCFGSYQGQKLVQDGPSVEEYSVHSQVFAILTGVVKPSEGKAMLQTTVGDPKLPQASVAFMFYLFRALEECGWYEKTDELWELWRQMVRDNMTTCVENDTDARSDCHAWASLLCYELPAVILGVRPAEPGFAKVKIAPQMGALSSASGEVITPKGAVYVEWAKTSDGSCELKYRLPERMQAV